ncbi:MAG: hypothetical protein SVR08_15755 [Spirochaetota bacterium]|nr:hypothetical protein [Spirochaetota bacterium]
MKIRVPLNKVTIIKTMPSIKYFKLLTTERKGEWSDDGVNIVGIRDDSLLSLPKEQKHNDIFIVIVQNKIKGYFIGSTEPGVSSYQGSRKNRGVAHLRVDDYIFKFVNGTKGVRKHGYLATIKKYVKVDRDRDESGGISKNPYLIAFEEYYDAGGDLHNVDAEFIHFHFGGSTTWDIGVSNFSHGCQVIAGDRWFYTAYQRTDYHNIDKHYHGAYIDFIREIKSGIAISENKIYYHLFNSEKINENIFNFRKWKVDLIKKN